MPDCVKKETNSIRSCLACRKQGDRSTLLRFVKNILGELSFDLRVRAPGRGAWVCPQASCIKKAVKKNGFARSLGELNSVCFDVLLGDVRRGLLSNVLGSFGVAFKTGKCVVGRGAVSKEMAQGDLTALVLSHDLSERSLRGFTRTERDVQVLVKHLSGPSKAELGRALGRNETGVVGLRKGNITDHIVFQLEKLGDIGIIS